MNGIIGFILSLLLTLLNQFNLSLETAFLQNDPAKLYQLMPVNSPILITLPEPFQVSDFFSKEQAFLIAKRLFRQISTLEFFIDQENPPAIDAKGALVQARCLLLIIEMAANISSGYISICFQKKSPTKAIRHVLR